MRTMKYLPGKTHVIANASSVSSITVTGAGAGYTSAPAVAVAAPSTPGGITATATAVTSAGAVTAINVTNPGSGYTAAPAVTLTGGGFTTAATAAANIAAQSVQVSFDPNTFAVRLVATGACHVEFGPNPSATSNSAYISPNLRGEVVSIAANSKIAAIQDGTSTGTLYVTELSA